MVGLVVPHSLKELWLVVTLHQENMYCNVCVHPYMLGVAKNDFDYNVLCKSNVEAFHTFPLVLGWIVTCGVGDCIKIDVWVGVNDQPEEVTVAIWGSLHVGFEIIWDALR